MGGGDLNMKKSWHPLLLKNQERVWLEEKKALEEKKKLDQLRKEKEEERQLQELQRMQEEQTGKKRTEKLEWMYSTPATGSSTNANDLEDYLLGKKRVDKILTGDENAKVGAAHKNFIAVQNANNVRDVAAKIREDPLLAIKQQEQASYEKLMSNPLRLRQMQERNGIKPSKLSKKEKKREKEERRKEKEERRRLKAEGKSRRVEDREYRDRDERDDRDRSRRDYDSYSRSPSTRRRYSLDDYDDERDRDRDYDRRRRYTDSRSLSRSRSPPPREAPHFRDGKSSEDSPLDEDDDYPSGSRGRDRRDKDFDSRSYSRRRGFSRSASPPSRRDDRDRDSYPKGSYKDRDGRDRDTYSKRPRSPSPPPRNRDSYSSSKRPRRSPPPSHPRLSNSQPTRDREAERAARLASMSSNASSMSTERQVRLQALLEKEKAELQREEEARKKSKGMGDFISTEQKKVFGGTEGGLEDRIRRGRGGMVIDRD